MYVLAQVPTRRRSARASPACVLVFSVMPPHPRGHMSFCADGWDVILCPSPDAVLDFHDPSDYARYVCTAWERERESKFTHI